jgi:hypothetical protein
MSDPTGNSHYVRRVVLPSGKTIEVVYFQDVPEHRLSPAELEAAETVQDLHICTSCDANLVYPTEWDEAGPEHWEVSLRCPNCEWIATGIFQQEIVERFDEELDRGTEALIRDLRRLMHANMEDEIERFVSAMREDHIQPMDF